MATKTELHDALFKMLQGYIADCRGRDVEPDDLLNTHTWLAIAYKESFPLLTKDEQDFLNTP